MKDKGFPFMVESGWLTRSFEQNSPYDLKYRGKITPQKVKQAFLETIDNIQTKHKSPHDYLVYIIQRLIIESKKHDIKIKRMKNASKLRISQIISMLDEHFEKSSIVGTARLPVLAIYSLYQCMTKELKRFSKKKLLPLERHTSADLRSGEIGDIQINSSDNKPFEAVEVKYGKRITLEMTKDCFEKFKSYPVRRYYLLSTAKTEKDEMEKIQEFIKRVHDKHGCQIIVNGIMESIKYYLRLISNTENFIKNYGENLEKDEAIKAEQKSLWNTIIKKMEK